MPNCFNNKPFARLNLNCYGDETLHLIVKKQDIQNNILKIIHILSKNGIYYLYLRDFYNLSIHNLDCTLFIKFYQCN